MLEARGPRVVGTICYAKVSWLSEVKSELRIASVKFEEGFLPRFFLVHSGIGVMYANTVLGGVDSDGVFMVSGGDGFGKFGKEERMMIGDICH
ncbi:hypothetical protein CDAR_175661 [Caerostris darwini]|uniref:Uncharacterized protein n=1 Tax=Caerostris darwini TaxID=1538125 RepID=A0AAV4X556_9ARAC|nr:hypothetical protein CDAR_175661 [Caerostris darwini]